MAKFLAFRRGTQEVVEIETVTGDVTPLGAALPDAATTALFPGRSGDLVATYKGERYVFYLADVGPPVEARLASLSGGSWIDVGTFPVLTDPTGEVLPIALHAVQDRIVAIAWRQNSAGNDGLIARVTTNGSTWTPDQALAASTQPLAISGLPAASWRNAVFVATPDGIAFYDPVADSFGAGFDTGDDTLLQGQDVTGGSFVEWRGDLYFVTYGAVATIYRLKDGWSPSAPLAIPAWEKIAATGLPAVNGSGVSADSGQWAAVVDGADRFGIFCSGTIGTRYVAADAASFPAFVDKTAEVVPPALAAAQSLGFAVVFEDFRVNERKPTVLIWEPTLQRTRVMRWDGTGQLFDLAEHQTTLLLPPRWGDSTVRRSGEPAVSILAVSQPFPGRVTITYEVRDSLSRPVDVFGHYRINTAEWLPMTQGDGDSGSEGLASSPTGTVHTFFWDVFLDLDGVVPFVDMRVVGRLAGA